NCGLLTNCGLGLTANCEPTAANCGLRSCHDDSRQIIEKGRQPLSTDPRLNSALGLFPGWSSAIELAPARWRQRPIALAAIFPSPRVNPATRFERAERTRQRRAVDGEEVSELPLRELATD